MPFDTQCPGCSIMQPDGCGRSSGKLPSARVLSGVFPEGDGISGGIVTVLRAIVNLCTVRSDANGCPLVF